MRLVLLEQRTAQVESQKLRPGEAVQVETSGKPVIIQLETGPKNIFDPVLYAPAIPGVLVALVGLFIAHKLTVARERKKEISELCQALKTSADDAANSSMSAWQLPKGDQRTAAIYDTKRKLQSLGVSATDLARRTRGRIDVVMQVADLRRAATADPFEDPERDVEKKQLGPIMAILASLLAEIDTLYFRRYRR